MNMNYLRIGMLLLIFIGALQVAAQIPTGSVKGRVIDSLKRPVEGATVVLSTGGGLVVKTALSSPDGQFLLEKIKYGIYTLSISVAGFQKYSSGEINLSAGSPAFALPDISLTPQSSTLQGVTVTSQKQLVERKIDRTVVNVDAMISAAGSTAFDVLEKSPGVSIDQNSAISLKGKQGVVIFIDDKPTYLSGNDLENYLRSLPASTIESIELMTNPPAKYDAAGGAGVINIRTKRSRVKGFNGTGNIAYTQGRYAKTNNSFNFNYRNNRLSMFGTAAFNEAENFTDLNINRYFKNPDGTRNYDFLQHTYIKPNGDAALLKIGADFYASEKTTFGMVVTGVLRHGSRNNDNQSQFIDKSFSLDSTIVAHNTQKDKFENGVINLNYRHKYAKSGPELTADLDYIRYTTSNNQVFNNYTYLPNGNLATTDVLTGALPAGIDIYSAKMDYSHPFAGGLKLETGLKASHTETDNIANYFATINNVSGPDYDKTNHFLYKETIDAAYLNLSKEMKRWSFQLGLRGEHTISDGHQLGNAVKADSAFNRKYNSLFPTAYVNYKLDSAGKHTLTLDYGKRINRPYYQDLNPFISPLDKFTYYTGNPFLLPAYTHNIELSYSYGSLLTLAASYGKTTNNTSETIEIVNGIYYSRPGNIGTMIVKSLSLDGNLDLTKWLTFHLYTEVTYQHSTSAFYTGPLDTKGTFWFVQPNWQFKFGKGWNVQLDGNYRTNVTNNQFILLQRGRLNLGVSKKLSSAATLRMTVNDMLYTGINRGIINNLLNTEANWRNAGDSRTVTIAFSYRFGKAIADQRKHNATGAQSEQNRVKD